MSETNKNQNETQELSHFYLEYVITNDDSATFGKIRMSSFYDLENLEEHLLDELSKVCVTMTDEMKEL